MAGAIKHMERSHRSHNKLQQYAIFRQFERKAYPASTYIEQRRSLVQHLGDMIKSITKNNI